MLRLVSCSKACTLHIYYQCFDEARRGSAWVDIVVHLQLEHRDKQATAVGQESWAAATSSNEIGCPFPFGRFVAGSKFEFDTGATPSSRFMEPPFTATCRIGSRCLGLESSFSRPSRVLHDSVMGFG